MSSIKARASSKLVKPTPTMAKASRKPWLGAPTSPTPPAKEPSQEVDAELTRALKQIFEARNAKVGQEPVTLFGQKLNQERAEPNLKNAGVQFTPLPRLGCDKLPPAATAHLLKELHKQRLKQKGITAAASEIPDLGEIEFVHTEKKSEVSTMPLLNFLEERSASCVDDDSDESGPKRQRVELDEANLSFSIWSYDGPTQGGATTSVADKVDARSCRSEAKKNSSEQLTLFYNGSVYVYDDVPSDKAEAIMVLASSISSKTSCYKPPGSAPPRVEQSQIFKKVVSSGKGGAQATATKASLQTFLEKRRIRFSPKAQAPQSEISESGWPADGETKKRPRSPSPTLLPDKSAAAVFSSKNEMETEMEASSTTTSAVTRQWVGV